MANPTSAFGWQMPTSTDLVTDLPADFEVFGQAVDTSLADLKGGTSGQILAKASNTDMDFTWITNDQGDITGVTAGTGLTGGGTSGAVTITNSMATAIDAKGDVIAGTGADAFARLAVGANGESLIADSTAATGLKWARSGVWTKVASGTIPAASSVTFSGLSGNNFYVFLEGWSSSSTSTLAVRVNGNNGANYADSSGVATGLTYAVVSASISAGSNGYNSVFFPAALGTRGHMVVSGANGGVYVDAGAAAITSLVFLPTVGSFDAGTYEVWSN